MKMEMLQKSFFVLINSRELFCAFLLLVDCSSFFCNFEFY